MPIIIYEWSVSESSYLKKDLSKRMYNFIIADVAIATLVLVAGVTAGFVHASSLHRVFIAVILQSILIIIWIIIRNFIEKLINKKNGY